MDTTPTSTPTNRSFGRNRRIALAGLALVTVGLLASCSGSGGADDAKPATTTKPVVVDGSSTTIAPDVEVPTGDQPVDGGNQGDTPQAPAPQAPAPAPQAPAPSGPKPVIYSFDTPENIDCHNGMFQNFSASWTTQNATKTTISIDGPGIYRTYGPNGSDSLPFNCSTPHTFLLTASGPGGKVTKSITLQPRNVQQPPTDDTDADPADSTTSTTVAP